MDSSVRKMILKIIEWCLENITYDLKHGVLEQSIRLLSVRGVLHIWMEVSNTFQLMVIPKFYFSEEIIKMSPL